MGLLVGHAGRRFVCFAIKCLDAGCPGRLATSEADYQSAIFDSALADPDKAGPWGCLWWSGAVERSVLTPWIAWGWCPTWRGTLHTVFATRPSHGYTCNSSQSDTASPAQNTCILVSFSCCTKCSASHSHCMSASLVSLRGVTLTWWIFCHRHLGALQFPSRPG